MDSNHLVRKLISLALEEDLALGDSTASLTVPEGHTSTARIIARQGLVVCGGKVIAAVIEEGRWQLGCALKVQDGEWLEAGTTIAELHGPTRQLLAAERTLLNFLQRLSGVATYTREFCAHAAGLLVLDTRKTMPGWRFLDKYAVRVGGGRNHRFCLGDMILVKNNHIDVHPGGMRAALTDIAEKKPPYMPWEVEVRNLEELSTALEFKPTIVMLDNFSDELLKEAVGRIRAVPQPPLVEASGGITRERLAAIKASGVDAVSVGALTTQAPNVDISMRIAR